MIFLVCWALNGEAARVKQVYHGMDTIYSNGGLNVLTILLPATVDTNRSFLMFETASASNRPNGLHIRGNVSSDSTISFFRLSDEASPGAPVFIQWSLVEFHSGVWVQRGNLSMAAVANKDTLSRPVPIGQSFVLFSKTPKIDDGTTEENDFVVAEVIDTNIVEFRVNKLTPEHHIDWQVITFTDPADIAVQKGSSNAFDGASTSSTFTLSTAVDLSTTFLMASCTQRQAGNDIGAKLIRAEFDNNTTIGFHRAVSGSPDSIPEVHFQVVELLDGSVVHSGTASFNTSEASKTVGIPNVNTSHSLAFASVQVNNGQSSGMTAYTADDIQGEAAFLIDFVSSSQISIQRRSSNATASVSWFVVEFQCGVPNNPVVKHK